MVCEFYLNKAVLFFLKREPNSPAGGLQMPQPGPPSPVLPVCFSPWCSITSLLLLCSEPITQLPSRGANFIVMTEEKTRAAKLSPPSTHCGSGTCVTSSHPAVRPPSLTRKLPRATSARAKCPPRSGEGTKLAAGGRGLPSGKTTDVPGARSV